MKSVLFVCVHNAGRSVMAEAFANAAGRLRAQSAGTLPGSSPHPEVVVAMNEAGIDVSSHVGRLLTDQMINGADRVITMGCAVDEDACPAIRYALHADWGLPDPKGRSAAEVREIRDEIRRRVEKLADELETENAVR